MSRWNSLLTIVLSSSMVAIGGTWLAVFDDRIGPASAAWFTFAVLGTLALALALRRHFQDRRSVGQILDALENPGSSLRAGPRR